MELLQWHKVCELGGDKLHTPPVVALTNQQLPATNNFSSGYHGIVPIGWLDGDPIPWHNATV